MRAWLSSLRHNIRSNVRLCSVRHASGRRLDWGSLLAKRGEEVKVVEREEHPHLSNMTGHVDLTFLGTASAAPNLNRNHSSLALRLDGEIWLFDAGEATQHQLQRSPLKLSRVTKIFVTHLHGDHVFGLVPFLVSFLTEQNTGPKGQQEPLEIFGPAGLRQLIRVTLNLTYSNLAAPYKVHELLFPSDAEDKGERLHPNEVLGDNIFCQIDGEHRREGGSTVQNARIMGNLVRASWPAFLKTDTGLTVSAAPLRHSVPCVGYFISEGRIPGRMDSKAYLPAIERNKEALRALPQNAREPRYNHLRILGQLQRQKEGEPNIVLPDGTELLPPPKRRGRQMMILGDTCDPTPMLKLVKDQALAQDPEGSLGFDQVDLLIHESTNAFLPPETAIYDTSQAASGLDHAGLTQRTMERGHSTPDMAGQFAGRLGMGMSDEMEVDAKKGQHWEIIYHLPSLEHLPSTSPKPAKRRLSNETNGSSSFKPNQPDSVARTRHCNARSLVLLNHFSARYGGHPLHPIHREIMRSIEGIAKQAWQKECKGKTDGDVVAALDFMQVIIPKPL